ncbi:MAG: hypothetical protein ACRD2O_07645 [Terriglobia bacterium]
MRARGEEAGDELQHLTQVNPRKADLIWVSVLANATPNIQPRSEWYWGRRRQDIDHSYFKRSPRARLGGRVEEGNDDDLMPVEKSDLLVRATKLAKASGAKEEMD